MSGAFDKLRAVMERLRHPENGCPWDVEQTFESIAPYTIEEAYEVADAIDRKDYDDLRDELGDLLLQVIYHARMAEEQGLFDVEDVSRAITEKMIRRHPHIFGDAGARGKQEQILEWEQIKAAERAEKSKGSNSPAGLLDDLPQNQPALMRAQKLQRRMSKVGFDWPDREGSRLKIDEELAELDAAIAEGAPEAIEDELGDLLFSVVNLTRHAGFDAETALRAANRKFSSRVTEMEKIVLHRGQDWESFSIEELDDLWNAAKQRLELKKGAGNME